MDNTNQVPPKIEDENAKKLRMMSRTLSAISECSEDIIHGKSEQEIFQRVCDSIVRTAGYRLAWVGLALNDVEKSVKPIAQSGYEEGYLEKIRTSWADTELGHGPTGTSIRERKPDICQNMLTEERFRPWREEAIKRGYASSICLPLLINGDVFSLCIYAKEADAFNEEEVKFLSQLAENLAFGVNAIRAENALQLSKNELQAILTSISDGIFTLDKDYRYVYLNDQAAIMVGKTSAKDLQGKILWDEFPEAKNTKYYTLYHEAMETKKVIRFEEYYPPFHKWYQGTIYPSPQGISVFFQDVTVQKIADEKIHKSEIELNEAQRIGHVGSWDWNAQTDKITWSEEYYHIIGLDPKTPPPNYQDHLKEYTPESAKRLDAAVQKALKTGEPYVLDLEQIRPNGTRGWIIARGEAIRDEKGAIIGLRGTAQDITERKAAEEKIHAAGAYNRNLIETSLDPMLTIDEKGKITDVNHAFEGATGRTRDQLIGTDVSQYFTDSAKVVEGLGKTLQEGFIKDYRVGIKNSTSGKILDCIWNTVVYKNQEGKVQGVFAAARDVSQLLITEKALQESERKYKAYIDNTYDIIYALDPSGIITYMSPRAKEYGVMPEAILGKKFDGLIAAEDREATLRAFQEGLEKRLNRIQVVFRYKNPAGKQYWFEAIGTVQYDAEGNPVSNIGVMRDITQRKLAEDRLKELDSVKSRFIRVVSHQLRTPLSAIRWQLESLLSERDHLNELQKQLIQESYRANLEIISSINDLITALDIEEGRAVHLDKVPTSIFSLWESIAIEFADRCRVKNITFETHKPSEAISLIELDTEKIRTVLQKLAENALMYTKEGGKIIVSLSQKEGKIHFEITDTGVGVPKDEQQYIFTRFYRASNASLMKPDASGLGLYIAKNFVESHGGKIGFVSAEGTGSTFWFELPTQ